LNNLEHSQRIQGWIAVEGSAHVGGFGDVGGVGYTDKFKALLRNCDGRSGTGHIAAKYSRAGEERNVSLVPGCPI
jgi:hypothetical protein